MAALAPYAPENDPIVRDGDGGFLGLDARNNPELLDAGLLQNSLNLRLDRGVAIVRNGGKSRGDVITGAAVLTLDFTLGLDINLVGITRVGGTATVQTATAHNVTPGRVVNLRDTGRAAYDADFFVLTTPTATTFTILVVGAPADVSGAGVMNAGPVLGTGPLTEPVRTAGRYVNAVAAGKPEFIVLVSRFRSYHYQEGIPAVPIVDFPAGEEVDDDDELSLLQALDRIYLFRKPQEVGNFAPFTITGITRMGGVATATAPGHWIQAGQRLRIIGTGQEAYNHEFDVTAITANSITFNVAHAPVTPATAPDGPIRAQRVKPPLYWDGVSTTWTVSLGGSHPAGPTFSRMPGNVVAAVYFNNQIGIARSKDEWAFSDVLDPDTFDYFEKAFRTGAGGNDYIVAGHVFADRDLLVLCRYSLWRIHIELTPDGISVDPAVSFIAQLTSEIGCRARDSVATVRQYIYFLSDAGVYRVDPNFTEQRLRELSQLLSDPVRPITERIQWDAADSASGVFHDSRYWLLVRRDDQSAPNMLLVFSLLNESWESVDLFTGLDGVALVTARYNGRERLFCAGGDNILTLLNERTDGDDNDDTLLPVAGLTRSRRYTLGGSQDVKRFLRFKAGVTLPAGASCTVRALVYDPEQVLTLTSFTAAALEDYVLKLPIRARGHSIEFEVELTGPGAQLRNWAVEAAGPSEPPEQRARTMS